MSAARGGVFANATGKGSVKVQAHGDVMGTSGYGIAATTTSGSIEIDLDAGTFVAGGMGGVIVQTQAGDAKINNAGTMKGGTGPGVVIDANKGSATINNSGKIVSGSDGMAIGVVSGAALVKNSGLVDGSIVSNGLTTMSNSGVWNNADGSTIQYLTNTGVISLGADPAKTGLLVVTGDASFGPGSYYNARITRDGQRYDLCRRKGHDQGRHDQHIRSQRHHLQTRLALRPSVCERRRERPI